MGSSGKKEIAAAEGLTMGPAGVWVDQDMLWLIWLSQVEVDDVIQVFFKDFIHLFMKDREREAETQAEGEAGSMQGV